MTILLTITHDPEAKMLPHLAAHFDAISQLFEGVVSEITQSTHYKIISLLSAYGYAGTQYTGGICKARRAALRNALNFTASEQFFYCDLDRLVHWYLHYPDELKEAARHNGDFTVYGRTRRAMATHPPVQKRTELKANAVFCKTYGQPIDVLAATRGISRRMAKILIARSVAYGPAGVDAEWPLIARRHNFEVGYVECEGLEYETDTFGIYRDEQAELLLRHRNVEDLRKVCATLG